MYFNPPQSRHPERSASQIYRKQRAYSAQSKDLGDACWQMLLRAFWPRPTTEDKKLQAPSVPGFPTSPLSPAPTYVVLPKENHMLSTEAAALDRKSGEAEESAVPRTFLGKPHENPQGHQTPQEIRTSLDRRDHRFLFRNLIEEILTRLYVLVDQSCRSMRQPLRG